MKFYIISKRTINSNTGQHGYGDYPETEHFVSLVVEADTKRKAQNKAKKINPKLSFGGRFGDWCETETFVRKWRIGMEGVEA